MQMITQNEHENYREKIIATGRVVCGYISVRVTANIQIISVG